MNHLAKVNSDTPLLMLAFSRPTLFERRAGWPGAAMAHARIDLRPLSKADSHLLAGELLQKLPEVPDTLCAVITDGAEGNPFYMEEIVLMLIDQRAIDASGDPWRLQADRLLATKVPATLTGVLQARLDGLPADERLTLQEASVIGQVFWDRALVALDDGNDATLPRLVQRALALPRPDAASDGLQEYAFKHALLHQVTYGTVLKRQRQLLHIKLAHWLAAQSQSDSARAGDFLGLTAQHFAEGGDAANAAEFHVLAAEHAAGRMAHARTLAHVQQGLSDLGPPGEDASQALLRWRLECAREKTWDLQGERDKQALDLDAMDGIAETLDDDARRAYAAYRRAERAHRMAAHAMSEQLSRRAVAMSDKVLARWSPIRAPGGPPADLNELRLFSLRMVGNAVMHQGRLDEAESVLLDALSKVRTLGLVRAQSLCFNVLGMLAERRDDRVGALALFREGLDLARQVGNRRNEAVGLGNVGLLQLALGDVAGAQRDLDAALRMVRQNGDRSTELSFLQGMSALMLWQGDSDRALAMARSALEFATAMQARNFVVSALVCLADAQASLGQHTAAAQAYADARVLGEEVGRGHRFDASAGLATLLLAQGEINGAVHALQPLLSSDLKFPGAEWPRKIELTMYQVLTAARDPPAIAADCAHSTLMAQSAAIADATLRHMFLTNIPHHPDITALWKVHGALQAPS